jgi:hypothetical protein
MPWNSHLLLTFPAHHYLVRLLGYVETVAKVNTEMHIHCIWRRLIPLVVT